MTALVDVSYRSPICRAVDDALTSVLDPELAEPITDTGLVQSVSVDESGVRVVLGLRESFGSAALAFVLADDVADALYQVDDIGEVSVEVRDHPDARRINTALASHACCLEGARPEQVDDVRCAFDRSAHAAAVRRCLTALLTGNRVPGEQVEQVLLRDLPRGTLRSALMRRRANLGLSLCPNSRVLVDHTGTPLTAPIWRPPIAS